MRKTLLAGLVLTAAAVLVVVVSAMFDLELESVALLGVALGAVIALVPDRTPAVRLAGFFGGFVVALMGYFVRAGLLPDSVGGRAVAVGLVVVLCVAIAVASMDRLPLWTTLLGAAALAGAYEYTYAAAPPEVTSTSVTAATSLLFTVAIGFLAAALVAPAEGEVRRPRRTRPVKATESEHKLDDLMMEKTK
ncbi:MAG TPA: hypothetical protein VFQ19_02170 [Nocardioidaceae bacterium]|nr:hypothetical protein [Nocardioidaceae bacterium]